MSCERGSRIAPLSARSPRDGGPGAWLVSGHAGHGLSVAYRRRAGAYRHAAGVSRDLPVRSAERCCGGSHQVLDALLVLARGSDAEEVEDLLAAGVGG